jgi:glycosyltransferase involved in cell wall biosynthesis
MWAMMRRTRAPGFMPEALTSRIAVKERHAMSTVAFVCRRLTPAEESHAVRQIQALTAAGHQVDVFAPDMPGLAQRVAAPRVRWRALTSPALAASDSPGVALWLWLLTCATLTIAQVQRRYHVIQIGGSTGPFIFASWLAHLFGGRIVLDLTTAAPERIMARTGTKRSSLRVRAAVVFEQYVVDYADHIIAPTETLRTRLMSRGCPPDKVSVIYRPPDERRFLGPLNVARHPDIAGRFLVVCREEPGEPTDFVTVIRAAEIVRQRLPQVLLWIVCPPAERPDLDRLIRQLDMTRHVLIQDAMDGEHVPAFIAQADAAVVAVPRDEQTDLLLPQGVLEGMALLVPTIAVRTQTTQYYFDPQSLLTYDSGDAGDLANRVIWLAQHSQARAVLAQHAREITTQVNWSRERHRYVALVSAVAALDQRPERAPGEAAGFSRLSRRRSTPIRAFTKAVNAMTPPIDPALAGAPDIASVQTAEALPLRLTTLSNEWRAGHQLRMRLGSWTLRGLATVLLFGIPVVASGPSTLSKVVTAAMFALVAAILVLLPPGEAAIIVALYFVVQRSIFTHFPPPEGKLGPIILYLGTALQLIVFAGFCVRAIVQQRPLLRSGFVLWPATLYIIVSAVSMLVNHVSFVVALLGLEHTLHNVVFVVLIAEDLPTVRQLRRYVGIIVAALSGMAIVSIFETAEAFHWLPMLGHGLLVPGSMPISVILPDADSYAYLLNFGILLALAMIISLNSAPSGFEDDPQLVPLQNTLLFAGLGVLSVAQFFTSSIENWVGLLAGLLALAVIVRGRWRPAVMGYLAALIVLSVIPFAAIPKTQSQTSIGRFAALLGGHLPHNAPLNRTLSVIRQHLWLGVGPGRFGGTVAYLTHSPVYQVYGFTQPKMIESVNLFWLHIAAETGIIGLIVFLWLMFQAERAIWRAYRKGAFAQWNGITAGVFGIVIAMSLATFFGNALEIDSLSAPFWALVGIAVALPIANRPIITGSLPVVRFRAGETGGNGHAPDMVADETPAAPTREGVGNAP